VVPQKWEYTWFNTGTHGGLNDAMAEAIQSADNYGQRGWEMVNFSANSIETRGGTAVQRVVEWAVACFLKRPLKP
jgi:hypothetical protein